jgi:hypothetical protein
MAEVVKAWGLTEPNEQRAANSAKAAAIVRAHNADLVEVGAPYVVKAIDRGAGRYRCQAAVRAVKR